MKGDAAPAFVKSVETRRLPFDGQAALVVESREVPVETPVGVVYNGVPYAVMMTSPADLEDFAYGFSLTEGVIADAAQIISTSLTAEGEGLRLDLVLSGEGLAAHLARRRAMAGRTGCGVCGITDLADLPRAERRPGIAFDADPAAIAAALGALDKFQPMNERTRAVHAAAFARADGSIALVREDVGRHNALDKLVGAMARARLDPAQGFAILTSRCSYEMVEKAAAAGVRALVAISAPTSLGVERARAHGMTLIAVARADSGLIFTS